MVHNSKIKRISLAVCLALMPFTAHALGLGKLTVLSGLGEPLNAEIELLAPTKEELSTLAARIAPMDAYAEQGIDRPAVLGLIKVEVTNNPGGTPVIKLSTPHPVNDPFLDMLIQVEWSTSRLLREYTALLDPPSYDEPKPAQSAVIQPVLSEQPASAAKPAAEAVGKGKQGKIRKHVAEPAHAAEKSAKEPVPQADNAGDEPAAKAEPTEGTESYKVHRGDTLNAIARQMQVEGVSLEQMMAGLYRDNKDAFAGDNMNRLQVGKILKVPDAETLKSISQQEAVQEIRVQAADWNAYRNKLAGKVAESAPTADQEGEGRGASGKITAPAEDKAVPPTAGPRDVVKLSKSDSAQGKNATAQEVANAKKEDSIAHDNAVKEANERVAALEKQVQEMQKLLQLKNQAMADMQKGASSQQPNVTASAKPMAEPAAKGAPVEKPSATTTAVPQPASKPEEATKAPVVAPQPTPPAEAKPAQAPKPAESQPVVEAKQPDAAKKPTPKKPAKTKKPMPPPPKPEPGLLDTLLENPLIPAGVGGLLIAVLGGAWFFRRSKRKKGLDSFENGILTSGGLRPNTVFGNTAGGTVDTGDVSFMTDFSHGAGAGMIDTSDVDPIAEAEVYMAYGRDAQAEEILKDAIAKEPARYELHHKLLEIYASRGDTSAFEALAGELYTTLGADNPNWLKVAEIGHKLEPDNPLYSSASSTNHANTTSMQAAPVADEPMLAESAAEDADFAPDKTAAHMHPNAEEEGLLGFDLGVEKQEAAPNMTVDEEPQESAMELPASMFITEPASASAAGEVAALDFQLDTPAASTSVPTLDMSASPATPETGLDFELPALAETTEAAVGNDGSTAIDFSLTGSMPAIKEATTDSSDIGISFELPGAEESTQAAAPLAPEPSMPEPPASLPTFEETKTDFSAEPEVMATPADNNLDISFDLPQGAEPEVVTAVEMPAITAPAEDMDRTMILKAPVLEDIGAEEIVFEPVAATPVEEAEELDISFDLDAFAAPAATEQPTPSLDIDLSGISLDFDETATAAKASPEVEAAMPEIEVVTEGELVVPETGQEPTQTELPTAPALEPFLAAIMEPELAAPEPISAAGEPESPDVETKLDLVTAYLDMGDAEGARELLNEVLNEGGQRQRQRAQAMLDDLG